MFIFAKKQKGKLLFDMSARLLVFALTFMLTFGPSAAQAQSVFTGQSGLNFLNLPAPGTAVPMTAQFDPVIVKGITLYPDNPLEFDFIINTGDSNLGGEQFEEEATKLIKYFLASLTVPEEEMWVNLSPYEQNRIIPDGFGKTEMGRDLLAQDYLLKQLTASLMNPEDDLGEKFWTRIYNKAQELYGTTEIPLNTFNKVWIVPEKAVVYQKGTNAFVVDSHLKVLLEEDYLALNQAKNNASADSGGIVTGIQSEMIREILIPEIEKEVNEGKTFANLRQIYNSMILATWYKQNLKESFLGKIYVNRHKTEGINTRDPLINEKIYKQYVEAFKKGVHNFIKEDYDPYTQEIIPRKYFSGGVDGKKIEEKVASSTITSDSLAGQSYAIRQKIARLGSEGGDRDVHFTLKGVSGGREIALLPSSASVGDEKTNVASSPAVDEIVTQSKAAIRWAEVVGYAFFMPFHSALLTGLLLFGVQHDVRLDALISVAIALVAGGSQVSLHEMDHLRKAVEVGSLKDKELQTELRELKQKSVFQRVLRTAGTFLGIPLGLVRGIKREGLSYRPQIKYNLYSEAWGVRGDRIRAMVVFPIAIVLFAVAKITGSVEALLAGQTTFAFTVANFFSHKLNDPGQYAMLKERLQAEADQKLELAKKGDAQTLKAGSLEERDQTWGGRKEDLERLHKQIKETRLREISARAGFLYERYKGRRVWDVTLRLPRQWRNSFNGGAHADKRFPGNSMSFQEGMFLILGAKDGIQAQEWATRLQEALQHEIEESEGTYMGLADEGGIAAQIEGKAHENDRDDELGRKMAQLPEVQAWRLMHQAIERAGLKPWEDVGLALDGAATQLEDKFREDIAKNTGKDAPIGQYYFYKAQTSEPIVLSSDEIIEMLRRMIVDYDVPILSLEDVVSERDLEAQEAVRKQFKGLTLVVVDDAAVTNSKNVERIVENDEGDTLLVKPNQIGDYLGLLEAMVTAAGRWLEKLISHRSQSPIDLMEPQTALAVDAVGMKTGGASTNTRIGKYNDAVDAMAEFERRIQRLKAGQVPEMTIEQRAADEQLSRLKKEVLEVTEVEVLKGNVNTSLPTAKVRVHFGIPGSPENHSVYRDEALTPIGASDGLGEAVHLMDSAISRQEIPEGRKYMNLFDRQENGSFKFRKDVTQQKVVDTGSDELLALYRRTLPFNGKDIDIALERFREKAADLLLGMKYSDLTDWKRLDELIQQRELQLYREFEQRERQREEADNVPADERLPERTDEDIILRKAFLGMQNMLASSFARYRLSAQLQGLRPWELGRLIYREGLAQVIAANGGMGIIPEEIRNGMVQVEGEALWQTIEANLSLKELEASVQTVNEKRDKSIPFYQVVREALGISFDAKSAAASSPVQTKDETPGGIDLDSAMLNLQVEQNDLGNAGIRMNPFPIPQVDIGGLVPVIMHVAPVNIQMLLGNAQEDNNSQELSYHSPDKFIDTRRRLDWQNTEETSWLN